LFEEPHHIRRQDFDRYEKRHYDQLDQHKLSWKYRESSMHNRRYLTPSKERNTNHRNHHDSESYDNSSESSRSRTRVHGRKVKHDMKPKTTDRFKKRWESHHWQKEEESIRRIRECQGLRGHFLSVSNTGIPYGHGVGAWRNELIKLCMALNPTIMDIWWQPEEDMKLLKERLAETFEYSNEFSDKYICRLAGNVVMQRRSKLWHLQRQGGLCPVGVDKAIWRMLDRIRKNPKREELS
jgi:hypothetical protein